MREKLVELLKKANEETNRKIETGSTNEIEKGWSFLADYLLKNGVTVLEWRPVTEPPKEAGEYIVMIKNGASATTLLFDGEFWFEENGDGEMVHYAVTHWFPLPEPPKGE